MPKGILEFNLPEDKEDFYTAQHGVSYKLVLWDLDQHLRGILKYNTDAYDEKTLEELKKIRDKLHELVNEYEVTL